MAYTNIKKSSDYFNTKLYTGNGVDDRSITGVGFQPDFTWIKHRNGTNYHTLFDVVRGVGKRLFSNVTEAEDTTPDSLQAFESDGFELGTNSGINGNTFNFASWNWKANGTGVANTDGTISSTVSASATSGFSIASYTGNGVAGATIGHGLGTTPNMIIQKNRDETQPWWVWHSSLTGANSYLRLNGTNAEGTDGTSLWNSTLPTSSVFSVGDNTGTNGSADACIAYCFAEKQGFSKFGSYVGNGNADGSFIYTGFSPAFVMIKETTFTGKWVMKDNRRTGINVNQSTLYANESDAEGTPGYELIDLLSNGFKQRGTGSYVNGSGTPYIYMAFAEAPLVGDNPATAR